VLGLWNGWLVVMMSCVDEFSGACSAWAWLTGGLQQGCRVVDPPKHFTGAAWVQQTGRVSQRVCPTNIKHQPCHSSPPIHPLTPILNQFHAQSSHVLLAQHLF